MIFVNKTKNQPSRKIVIKNMPFLYRKNNDKGFVHYTEGKLRRKTDYKEAKLYKYDIGL